MNFEDRLKTLRRLHDLIRRKSTGNYQDLSRRLDVSPATLYRLLDQMKEMGAPIVYNRSRKAFYYQKDFDLVF